MDIGLYEGTIGDGLLFHIGMGFSTIDQDNDYADYNCAEYFYGAGWWYRVCCTACLTNQYGSTYFMWSSDDSHYILSKAQMMVRPSSSSM
ncbi:unnamed protein product, partial [Meganyctiphanes norvegica]